MDVKPQVPALLRFVRDESGEYALEVILILAFVIVPLITAVWLLQDVLKEYVAMGQVFISSPFF